MRSNASPSPADAIPFDTATPLAILILPLGDGRPGEWLVVDNDAGRGLAQIDAEPAEKSVAVCHLPPLHQARRRRVDALHGPLSVEELRPPKESQDALPTSTTLLSSVDLEWKSLRVSSKAIMKNNYGAALNR